MTDPITLDWLTHSIPLWAFLLALLTSPWTWSRRVTRRVSPLLDRVLPTDDDNPVNK